MADSVNSCAQRLSPRGVEPLNPFVLARQALTDEIQPCPASPPRSASPETSPRPSMPGSPRRVRFAPNTKPASPPSPRDMLGGADKPDGGWLWALVWGCYAAMTAGALICLALYPTFTVATFSVLAAGCLVIIS